VAIKQLMDQVITMLPMVEEPVTADSRGKGMATRDWLWMSAATAEKRIQSVESSRLMKHHESGLVDNSGTAFIGSQPPPGQRLSAHQRNGWVQTCLHLTPQSILYPSFSTLSFSSDLCRSRLP
jgi:hypothetical protein